LTDWAKPLQTLAVPQDHGHASFREAATAILAILDDGEWHKSTEEIREPLQPWVTEHMFRKVKSRCGIEHRQVWDGQHNYVEWRRAKTE
jgi:hypothetical protein